MEKLILKNEIVTQIKKDPILFGKVASILGIGAPSLPRVLASNSFRLTEASCLKVLREHLGIKKDSEMLTDKSLVEAV